MSFWSRIANVFHRDRLSRELDEEMEAHIEEAIAHGRSPSQARRAFGHELRLREESHDVKVAQRLDSLRADAIFGVRQLFRHKVTSGAAIVSLALAIGSCTAAFRLIDAALLPPLPVADPGNLYFLTNRNVDPNGGPDVSDSFEYPLFRELRASVKNDAELLAISYASPIDLTYSSDLEVEKAQRQYVSGEMFPSFGLKPAMGRLLTPADDLKPGAHPYAVLSYEYWTRRFGQDPGIVGRTFRTGNYLYEIVGVSPQGFTGTETGRFTDIFVPTMMNADAIEARNWGWFRIWVRMKPEASVERVRQHLQAAFAASRRENTKEWHGEILKRRIDDYVNSPLSMEPAAAGVSGLQTDYRRSLGILGVLVALVLLIACANVANLLTVQAASRAREMALRISIGAGRWRLVQLMLAESTIIALLASGLGGLFAWWSAPIVVGMLNPPDNPARLTLPADWRVLGFGVALAIMVTLLFGLGPALRASSVMPMITLKGGDDPHSRRRLMNGLVAAQVAFCFLVHFLAGLFIATFDRLSKQPLGFSAERVLILETVAKAKQPAGYWDQVTQHLQQINGVESAALSGWALMSGNRWTGDISIDGRPPEMDRTYFMGVSPGWLETMQIGLREGRDFRPDDTFPTVGIVNEAFARRYFNGQNPIGKSFEQTEIKKRVRTQVVGWVRDARYRDMRESVRPTVYVPVHATDEKTGGLRPHDWGTFVVRTSASNPTALASMLRREVTRARPELRVSSILTQTELVEQHTIRERLLATLSLFFAMVALVLAGVGLYGVLNYSVLQRQREIGIRMALGARASHVAWRVAAEVFGMLLLGAFAGFAAGAVAERYVETLLYEVKETEVTLWVLPAMTIFTAALLAVLPPIVHAVRIDPAKTLRAE